MHLLIVGFLISALVGLSVDGAKQENFKAIDNTTYDGQDVALKWPVELIRLRGYEVEEHYAHTKDGYHIYVVRIINPKWAGHKLRRPVIFNHGLLGSATTWLTSSLGAEPDRYPINCDVSLNETLRSISPNHFSNGPMLLSNMGHDVWLMSMRGTDLSLRHDRYSHQDPQFWNYCLDDFGLVDIPTVVEYVRRLTRATKIGYVGHSQATFSVFGLLSTRPRYANLLEPVVAVAPVAYMDHITSIARQVFLGALATTELDQHGPVPRNPLVIRKAADKICKAHSKANRALCQLLEVLISGKGKKLPAGFFTQMPYTTSLKVLRHFGQLVHHKRFMMYDYGANNNRKLYGVSRSPDYPVERIRSRSIVLFYTKTDALSPPKDVLHFKSRLRVPLFRDIYIDREFNHFDMILDPASHNLVFRPMAGIFAHFERNSRSCEDTKITTFTNIRLDDLINSESLNSKGAHNETSASVSHNENSESIEEEFQQKADQEIAQVVTAENQHGIDQGQVSYNNSNGEELTVSKRNDVGVGTDDYDIVERQPETSISAIATANTGSISKPNTNATI